MLKNIKKITLYLRESVFIGAALVIATVIIIGAFAMTGAPVPQAIRVEAGDDGSGSGFCGDFERCFMDDTEVWCDSVRYIQPLTNCPWGGGNQVRNGVNYAFAGLANDCGDGGGWCAIEREGPWGEGEMLMSCEYNAYHGDHEFYSYIDFDNDPDCWEENPPPPSPSPGGGGGGSPPAPPGPPPPSLTFQAIPSVIHYGEYSDLTYQASNITSCSITGQGGNFSGSSYVRVYPTVTTTYTMNCYVQPNVVAISRNATVTVTSNPDPVAFINVNVGAGCSANWTMQPGNYQGSTTYSMQVTPPPGGTNYSIVATSPQGYTNPVITPSATQHVNSGETVSFDISCSQIPESGECSSPAEEYYCNSSTASPVSSRVDTGTQFTWTCPSNGVAPATDAYCSKPKPTPTVDVTINNLSSAQISSGSSFTLAWTSYNASTCTMLSPSNVGSVALNSSQTISSSSGSPWYPSSGNTVTYTVRCQNAYYSATDSATVSLIVPPPPPPPIVAVNISPNPINYGESTTVTWSSSNSTYCDSGGHGTGTNGSFGTGALTTSTTYTVICYGAGGNGYDSDTAVVISGAPPTYGSITNITSCDIALNQSTCTAYFSWTTTNPVGTSAITSPSFQGNVFTGNNGTNQPKSIPHGDSNYYLYNGGNMLDQALAHTQCVSGTEWSLSQGSCQPVVTESGPVSVDVTALPPSVAYNGSSNISWSSQNASYCDSGGHGTGTTGSFATGALTANTEYVVYCYGAYSATAYDSVTVGVAGAPYGSLSTNSPCYIALNENECALNFTWETFNPIGTSAITSPSISGNVFTGNSGTNQPYDVSFGDTTFYLYNNAQELDQTTTSALCTAGTEWNSSNSRCQAIVVPPGMSGSLSSPTSCTISEGNDSCNVNMSWLINNPEAVPTAITASGMSNINVTNTLATPQSGVESVEVPYNHRTFYLYNNGEEPPLDFINVFSSCENGTEWNGSICEEEINPPIGGGDSQCSDGADNDGDTLEDCDDPSCHTDNNASNAASCDPDDTSEVGAGGLPQCSDTGDNDGDGLTDCADPDCHTDGNASNAASCDPNRSPEGNTTKRPIYIEP